MPIIIVTVPPAAGDDYVEALRERIYAKLEARNVFRKDVTVVFLRCVAPDYLLVLYLTRQEELLENAGADAEAEAVGQLVEKYFNSPVECLVHVIEKGRSGIYLTAIAVAEKMGLGW